MRFILLLMMFMPTFSWCSDELYDFVIRGDDGSYATLSNKLVLKDRGVMRDIDYYFREDNEGGKLYQELVKKVEKAGNWRYLDIALKLNKYASFSESELESALSSNLINQPEILFALIEFNQINDVSFKRIISLKSNNLMDDFKGQLIEYNSKLERLNMMMDSQLMQRYKLEAKFILEERIRKTTAIIEGE